LTPLVRNGHLQTILGNFWSRPVTEDRFPLVRRLYQTEDDTQVAVDEQLIAKPLAHAVMVHGLEGSSQSGYIRSLSRDLLEAGVSVHRFNMRSCGGTEHLSKTNYHAGQTSDLRHVLTEIRNADPGTPLFLIGYSLGGNASLKLAGELRGEPGLLDGVCGVSTPLDLARCCDRINDKSNFIYQQRFLKSLKGRIRRRHATQPEAYDLAPLPRVRSIWEFDDTYTSKLFGFGTALNYFRTQSAGQYLREIDMPCLVIHAKDDPLIPFEVYERESALRTNPNIRFLPFDTGGHVGFLARESPRFWIDPIVTSWLLETRNKARK
jgi:predicted alpha/beta-fold hydrolase